MIEWHHSFLNRCISVYFPRRDIYSQRKTAKMTIAFCWIFPIFMLSLPLTNLWGQFGLECGTKNCVILRDKSGKTLQSFLTLVGFFLPLLTLIICNIAIYIRVKVTKYLKMNICLRNLNFENTYSDVYLLSFVENTSWCCFRRRRFISWGRR